MGNEVLKGGNLRNKKMLNNMKSLVIILTVAIIFGIQMYINYKRKKRKFKND